MRQSSFRYAGITRVTYDSAQKIVPIVVQLVGLPESVVDLGGGGGGFLRVFKSLGTREVVCIDHPSVSEQDLLIARHEFIPCDLTRDMPQPIRSDLAISTEFAEHIPKPKSAAIVDFLTTSASVVLFSAAVPGQGGLDHVNEQRPAFWMRLFAEKGFEMVDAIRPKILFDETIPVWLRQNLYLYVDSDILKTMPLSHEPTRFIPHDFEIVHTRILDRKLGLREVLRELMPAFFRMLRHRI